MIKMCPICKKEFYVRPCYIKYGRAKTCSKSCAAILKHREGKDNLRMFKKGYTPWNKNKKMLQTSNYKHWNWKNGKHPYGEDGYIYILKKDHKFCTKLGYIAEHRLIMENHIGRYLKPSERVHHINGNKQDNRIENLMLFDSESSHLKFHHPKGKPVHIH